MKEESNYSEIVGKKKKKCQAKQKKTENTSSTRETEKWNERDRESQDGRESRKKSKRELERSETKILKKFFTNKRLAKCHQGTRWKEYIYHWINDQVY